MKYVWILSAGFLVYFMVLGDFALGKDAEFTSYIDLTYVADGHSRQILDIFVPDDSNIEKFPLIVWVHGGGWRGGDKKNCPAKRYLNKGFAVASINYRLSQHAVFPAQIEDCKTAIRFLRANASRFKINPKKIGVWGSSAGGHLVAMLGTTGDVNDFDKGPWLGYSSEVQAVCDYYGPTDFLRMNDFEGAIDHDAADSPESKLIGGPIQENPKKVKKANPITYVSRNDPPFLIVHGDRDRLVPVDQSRLLYEALREKGAEAKFHIVQDAGHSHFKGKEVNLKVLRFFEKHLK